MASADWEKEGSRRGGLASYRHKGRCGDECGLNEWRSGRGRIEMVQEQLYSGGCRIHGHVNDRGQKDDSQGRIDFVHVLDDVVWRGRWGALVVG